MNSASIMMPGSPRPAGEFHSLGGELTAEAEVAAHGVPLPDAEHEREELARLADAFAELSGTAEDRADFGRGVAAHGEICDAKRGEQLELPAVSRR